jgi:D-serine deaminase-like pyridoxal phosphate-dependent protein
VDAGGLALSKDRSTQGHPFDCRFGWVCDDTGAVLPDVWVEVVHQEIGVITHRLDAPLDFERLKIGTVLRVQPNHADMTAAAYEGYHLVRGGQVEGFWPRINGW